MEQTTIEKTAKTIDDAIADGLEELGLSESDVVVEVLDEGGKGLLGFGARLAHVRLTALSSSQKEEAAATSAEAKEKSQRSERSYDAEPADVQNTMSIATETVRELLDKMRVTAEVSARLGENAADEQHHPLPIVIDISGDDLSYLIGKKAETLNALQYIVRLIVGKEVGHATNIIVDIEGYRTRRELSLRQLAERMAKQAVSAGSKQTLEPMNPAERRIIHIALRDFDGVYTQSAGEEPRRKVVIIPED